MVVLKNFTISAENRLRWRILFYKYLKICMYIIYINLYIYIHTYIHYIYIYIYNKNKNINISI